MNTPVPTPDSGDAGNETVTAGRFVSNFSFVSRVSFEMRLVSPTPLVDAKTPTSAARDEETSRFLNRVFVSRLDALSEEEEEEEEGLCISNAKVRV